MVAALLVVVGPAGCGTFILFCSVCVSGFCNVCVCEGFVMCGCFW